jgi:hypothetical protein
MYNSWTNCYRLTCLTGRDRIVGMKFVSEILQKLAIKKASTKTLSQYKEELLFQEGREQFKRLIQIGLNIPVHAL